MGRRTALETQCHLDHPKGPSGHPEESRKAHREIWAANRQMYKALKKAPVKPLVFVVQEDGQLTADPEVVDRKARKAWEKVYQGMPG